MNCCGNHGNHEQGQEHHLENHDEKKSSWLVWGIWLIIIGILVFSLFR